MIRDGEQERTKMIGGEKNKHHFQDIPLSQTSALSGQDEEERKKKTKKGTNEKHDQRNSK